MRIAVSGKLLDGGVERVSHAYRLQQGRPPKRAPPILHLVSLITVRVMGGIECLVRLLLSIFIGLGINRFLPVLGGVVQLVGC